MHQLMEDNVLCSCVETFGSYIKSTQHEILGLFLVQEGKLTSRLLQGLNGDAFDRSVSVVCLILIWLCITWRASAG
jgi:hypothetical protein